MKDQSNCVHCNLQCLLPVEIECGHRMCFLCVKELILKKQKQCPKCSQPIPRDYLRKIVLVDYEIIYKTPDSHCWQYSSNSNSFWMFDERSNTAIEKAYNNKSSRIEITIGPYNYIIDFAWMRQFRSDNPRLSRKIRRDNQTNADVLGVAGVHFPKNLSPKYMIDSVNSNKEQRSISDSADPAIWLYRKDTKWLEFDLNTGNILEYYYKTYLDNELGEFKLKIKNEEYEVDFKNWLMIKGVSNGEQLSIKRKSDGALLDSLKETEEKDEEEEEEQHKTQVTEDSFEESTNNKLDIKNYNFKQNENKFDENENEKDENNILDNTYKQFENTLKIEALENENENNKYRWYFKNENNNWIGISEKETKYIEKVYIDYLMNQNNKFEMTDDGQTYIIDFKSHVKYKKGMEQEQQVLQRAENTNEAESKFTKVIIDRKLADKKMIKSESWYVHIKNEWQKYDQEVCSLLDEAYLKFFKTPESNCISNEIDGRQCVFDFAQFTVLDCSNMNMTRFKRGSKSN